MTEFPLCIKAGLDVQIINRPDKHGGAYGLILADEVESFLASAPVVYGCEALERTGWSDEMIKRFGSKFMEGKKKEEGHSWNKHNYNGFWQTHQARLIMIEPIKKKSREERATELLKKFLDLSIVCKTEDAKDFQELFDSSRELLAEPGEKK